MMGSQADFIDLDSMANQLLNNLGFHQLTDKGILSVIMQGEDSRNFTIIGKGEDIAHIKEDSIRAILKFDRLGFFKR
jgi:hypothetical protein